MDRRQKRRGKADPSLFVDDGQPGLWEKAERWLARHGVRGITKELYLVALERHRHQGEQRGAMRVGPDLCELLHGVRQVEISYDDWHDLVLKLIEEWERAGWARVANSRWHFEKTVGGVRVGAQLEVFGVGAHCVLKKDRQAFPSETGFRHFSQSVEDLGDVEPFERELLEWLKHGDEKRSGNGAGRKRGRKSVGVPASRVGDQQPVVRGKKTAACVSPNGDTNRAVSGGRGELLVPAEVLPAVLTKAERKNLERLERVVQANLLGFVEVGRALTEIQQRRLYRETHATFEAYCQERWDMGRQHAYRLIEASAVVAELSHHNDRPVPANEAQARPLARVDSDLRGEVWQQVLEQAPVDEAGNPRITGGLVEKVVHEWLTPGDELREERLRAQEPREGKNRRRIERDDAWSDACNSIQHAIETAIARAQPSAEGRKELAAILRQLAERLEHAEA
ncbi:MAG: hypothetical protein ACOY3P_26195 [Planctomycetota bacterium]